MYIKSLPLKAIKPFLKATGIFSLSTNICWWICQNMSGKNLACERQKKLYLFISMINLAVIVVLVY